MNNYTVQPLIWGDFYAILALDGNSIVRNYVVAMDPHGKEHFRRMSAIEREEALVPQEVWDKQAVIDLEHARVGRVNAYKNDYQRGINLQIINGTLDHIPENLEEDAEAFAKEKIKREDEDKLNEELEANKTQGSEVIIENIVDPLVEPIVDTPIQTEGTPSIDPTLEPIIEEVVEPIVETPSEIIPDETKNPTIDPIDPIPPEIIVAPIVEPTVTTSRKRSS